MATIKIDAKLNRKLEKQFEELNNDTTMLLIHNTLAKKCDPYVPFAEGPLSQTIEITAKGVRYTQPYARYQYYGEVYGPNIPITQDGMIVGWFSPPGQPKQPTGRTMNHSTERHPLATSFWDKAMLRDKGDEFRNEIELIVRMRLKKFNG